MVDHIEALLAAGPIHRGDVNNTDKLAGCIVAQEGRDLDDVGGPSRYGELAAYDLVAGNRRTQRVIDRLPKPVEHLVHSRLRSTLDRAGAADLLLQQHHAV